MKVAWMWATLSLIVAVPAYAEDGPKIVLQVGTLVGGDGEGVSEVDNRCWPVSGCPPDERNERNLGREESGPTFGVDLLFGDQTRWGLSLLYTLNGEFGAARDGDTLKYGTDLQLNGVFEMVPRRWESSELFVRLIGGIVVLFPGQELEDNISDGKDQFRKSEADFSKEGISFDWEIQEGPFVGYDLGGGAGIDIQLAAGLALRFQLMVQYWYVDLVSASMEAEGGGATITSDGSLDYSGTRWWVLAGLVL